MRYELPIRYLARVWLDVAPVAPSDTVFKEMRALIGGDDLSPAVATESSPGGSTFQRQALVSPSGLAVLLPGESFDVMLAPVTDSSGAPSTAMGFSEFTKVAARILTTIAKKYEQRPGKRLACLQEGFLEASPALMQDLPRRVFHLPELVRIHGAFEWDWRLATRIERKFGAAQEPLNTIVTLKRVSGTMASARHQAIAFDKIRLDLDISSSHSEMQLRFSPSDVESFFNSCAAWHSELWRQMEDALQIEER